MTYYIVRHVSQFRLRKYLHRNNTNVSDLIIAAFQNIKKNLIAGKVGMERRPHRDGIKTFYNIEVCYLK